VRRTLTLTTVADSAPVYSVVAGALFWSIGFGRSADVQRSEAVCSARSANTVDGALNRCRVSATRARSRRSADAASGGAETAKQRTAAADVAPPAIVWWAQRSLGVGVRCGSVGSDGLRGFRRRYHRPTAKTSSRAKDAHREWLWWWVALHATHARAHAVAS
jgi:hypothetical protein